MNYTRDIPWDGQMAADSIGASVYQAFSAALTRRLAQAKAPNAWPWAIGQGFGQIVPRTLFSTRAMSKKPISSSSGCAHNRTSSAVVPVQ